MGTHEPRESCREVTKILDMLGIVGIIHCKLPLLELELSTALSPKNLVLFGGHKTAQTFVQRLGLMRPRLPCIIRFVPEEQRGDLVLVSADIFDN